MIARDRLRKAILLLAVLLLPAWTVSASASGEWLAFSGSKPVCATAAKLMAVAAKKRKLFLIGSICV